MLPAALLWLKRSALARVLHSAHGSGALVGQPGLRDKLGGETPGRRVLPRHSCRKTGKGKGKGSQRSEEAIARRLARGLARRLQREADNEERALEEGRDEESREVRTAPDFDFNYLEALALQGGSRQNLAAVPETREFVDDERSLWTGLGPRDRNSVNYKRAQKACEAVFRGTPFAQRFLEDRPGKQARASFARDRAVERVASGASSSSAGPSSVTHRPGSDNRTVEGAATTSHPATTVFESSEEETVYPAPAEGAQQEGQESDDETHFSVTEDSVSETRTEYSGRTESTSWQTSTTIWNRDNRSGERNQSWEQYKPYYNNYRYQQWGSDRYWGRHPY